MVAYNKSIIFSLDCIRDDEHYKLGGFGYFLLIFHLNKY